MKKTLLLAASFLMTALGMQAAVGDDLTSKYLQNADFSSCTPLQCGVTTYAKDAAGAGTTLSGMQPVDENWTANYPYIEGGADIDARAAGIFELGKQYVADYTGLEEDITTPIFLGGTGYLTPAPTEEDGGPTSGNVLGIVAVWGADAAYTQPVTLPAGAYTISVLVYNGGGETAVAANEFGFKAEDGTTYYASETTWTVNAWTTMTVNFSLETETSGVISLGYKSAGAGSAAMPHLYISSVKILAGDESAIEKEKADALRPDLLTLLEQAEELGVDASAEQAVYDDESATAAQVQAAIDSLKEKNANAMTDFTDYFINNAHFALGTPMDNGVCTYDYDMEKNSTKYYGMQPIQDWTASNPSTNTVESVNNGRASGLFAVGSESSIWLGSVGDVVPATKANGATEGNLFGFISVWTASSSYTQNVTLPAGSYTITIPTYNERGTGAVAKNLCGFIADDGTEYLATTTTFPVGKWSNETIKFSLEEETSGVITIGYQAANAGSGSMPHLFIDEFTLMFNGKTDINPSLIALNGAIRSGETYLETEDPYYAELKTTLEDAIEKGNELKDASSDDDAANTAAATAINNAIADVKASIAVYKNFHTFLEGTLTSTQEKYNVEGGELQDFGGTLADDYDTYLSAYENGEYTNDQINAIIDGFNERVSTAVFEAFAAAAADGEAHNIDITPIYYDKNFDFANSTVTGWQNETGTSAFLSRVQTAEVWNQTSFNCYIQLENMPAGVYELQIPGFYRSADNTTNYSELQAGEVVGKSYIYVGGCKQLMHNVAEESYLLHAEAADDNHAGAITEGELYVVNSNANAHYYFYDQTDADCMNTVSGALAELGTLTFGVKGEGLESNEWTVWGAAKLIYKGSDGMSSTLYAELQSKQADLETLAEEVANEYSVTVNEGDNMKENALGQAEECDEDSEVATLTAAIKAVDEATAYYKESETLLAKLQSTYTDYNDYIVLSVEENDEPTFAAAMEAAASDEFETNDAIQTAIDNLKNTWATYVQYPVLGSGSEDTPGDVSAAIINRGFEGYQNDQTEVSGSGDASYWTLTNGNGYLSGVYEFWNAKTADIHQTINGLADGYYKLRVQSFFRAANTSQENADAVAGDSVKCAAYLYAYTVDGADTLTYKAQIKNQIADAQPESVDADNEEAVTVNEATVYVPSKRGGCASYFDKDLYWNEVIALVKNGTLTVGITTEGYVTGDWCPFDNFELLWIGTKTPTGVEGVKADATVNTTSDMSIYDLSGRRVSKAQKGIYIMNGKKVIR